MPARFIAKSSNEKLSPVTRSPSTKSMKGFAIRSQPPFCSSTYASIASTCQDSCPFKSGGCYAEAGFTRIHMRRMDAEAKGAAPVAVARFEAQLIDGAWPRGVPQDGARGGRDLRLHVGGDSKDTASATLLAGAAKRWRARGGGSVWNFTHSWRSIPVKAWGVINTIASVETVEDAHKARALGYSPALVVEQFPNGDKAWDIGGGVKAIPCPAQTRDTTCVQCRLCLDRPLHSMKRAIAFEVHGRASEQALVAIGARQ